MSAPSTPKRSPSPPTEADQPPSTRHKTSPSSADDEVDGDGVVLDEETSLTGLYADRWLTALDKSDERYPANDELNGKVHIWSVCVIQMP